MTAAYIPSGNAATRNTTARAANVETEFQAISDAFETLPTSANLVNGTANYAVDTGTANALLVAMPKTATSYTDGMLVVVKALVSNTGNSTIDVDGLGVKQIRRQTGSQVVAGDIVAGSTYEMRYNGTYFMLTGFGNTLVESVDNISSDISTVAGISANVTSVASNETNINSAVTNEANITAAASNEANITAAVTNASNINAAVSNASNINAVASNATNINTVAANDANVTTVATNDTNISTVATNNANVTLVADNITDVVSVGSNMSTITSIEADITTVSANNANITTVANNDANITTVATNMADVQNASAIVSGLTATDIGSTAAGNISATNVQAAITELDTEKLARTGGLIKDFGIEAEAHGNTGAAMTIDIENGNYHTATVDQATTLTFSNPTASGDACIFYLELTNGGAYVVTWPGAVSWDVATAPTLQASGVDILAFVTTDGGTTWRGFPVWQAA